MMDVFDDTMYENSYNYIHVPASIGSNNGYFLLHLLTDDLIQYLPNKKHMILPIRLPKSVMIEHKLTPQNHPNRIMNIYPAPMTNGVPGKKTNIWNG
jgi:hypothetical protein